jgi:putative intracellular protease/amidase
MNRAVHVLVFDGYADWELALALAELRRSGGFPVVSVGFSRDHATSMGGLRVAPDVVLEELQPRDTCVFLLPGGDSWEKGEYPVAGVESKLREVMSAGVPVAAICGATVALARAGLLEGYAHTSNDRGWLAHVAPGYAGSALYRDDLAVRDRGIITASGTGSVEFAREVLAELDVLDEEKRAIWFHLFKTGRFPPGVDPAAFFAA